MSHDTNAGNQSAAQQGGFDWSDPHHFHHGEDAMDHGHEGHHALPWQLLVVILFVLLFLTGLTVFSAEAERWLIGLGVSISHFWNVVIALSIATVKATLVCMYFMHLKHDNPLNTMILLTTIFVFGLFILFTGIDLYERDAVNEWKMEYVEAGGTGASINKGGVYGDGTVIGDPITWWVKQKNIDKYADEIAAKKGHVDDAGEPAPTEDDVFEGQKKFWFKYYDKKFESHPGHMPEAHFRDAATEDRTDGVTQREQILPLWIAHHHETHGHHHASSASESVPRRGLTPGLFGDADPHAEGHEDHSGGDHTDGDH